MMDVTERLALRKKKRRELKRARKRCRCCGKLLLENVSSKSVREETEHGFITVEEYYADGTWGWGGRGICTLRCAMKWANAHAPRLS